MEREINTLVGQLTDPGRSDKTKVEAAELLLIRSWDKGIKHLSGFLTGSTPPNPRAQIAVAEAIARCGAGRLDEFIAPLMAMLKGKDATVRLPAARALSTYKNSRVVGELLAIASSRKYDKAVRLATIASCRQVLEKRTVGVLIQLLDDPDEEIVAAASDTLAKLTNVSAFRKNIKLAKEWWRKLRGMPQDVWFSVLADSLARANSALEAENTSLRVRLRKAMFDLYAAAPASQQDAMLVGFLNDHLGDVRLVGATLTERKIAAGDPVTDEIRQLVRAMLQDPDPRCREASAVLVANLGGEQALELLLAGLETEKLPSVRRALFSGLGKLRDAKAVPAVLGGIRDTADNVVAAAASALTRIASKQPLTDQQRTRAAEAIIERYPKDPKTNGGNGTALREALLGAMGMLGKDQPKVVQIVMTALSMKHTAATTRLAAVNAAVQMGLEQAADTIAALVGDPGRGVRMAAITALSSLAGQKHLKTILAATQPPELDDTVRQHAWEVAVGILSKSDAAVLEDVLRTMADWPDAAAKRIKVLQLRVAARKGDDSPKLTEAHRELGSALMAASRPAEAATVLAEAYKALEKVSSDYAGEVWIEWVGALLKADAPTVVKVIAEQKDEALYSAAAAKLVGRLAALTTGGKFTPAIRLAEGARALSDRATAETQTAIQTHLSNARAGQLRVDRKRVAELAPQLLAADEMARTRARTELQDLGERAVVPLLEYLRETVAAATPSPQAEKAVLALLGQIAPKLTGYDVEADQAGRLRQIDQWLKG